MGKDIIMGLISSVFFSAAIVFDFMLPWDERRQQLWDEVAGTVVVSGAPVRADEGEAALAGLPPTT